jgi:hypothetical protein
MPDMDPQARRWGVSDALRAAFDLHYRGDANALDDALMECDDLHFLRG